MKSDSSEQKANHEPHEHDHGHGCCSGHDHHDHHHGETLAEHDHTTDLGFFFWLKVAALFVWGGVLIYFYASGRVDYFLTGDGTFRVQTAIAGLGLFVLGLFNVMNRKVQVDCGHEHHDHSHHSHDGDSREDEGCGHDHTGGAPHHHHEDRSFSGQLTMLIILLLPVTAAAMTTKNDYSDAFKQARMKSAMIDPEKSALPDRFDIRKPSAAATADANKEGESSKSPPKSGGLPEFTLEDLESFVKRSDDGNFMISLIELFYSAGDVEVRKVLNGQPVETVAQVVEDSVNNPDGTRLRAFRMFMQCCAADSRPVSIAVEFGDTPPPYKEMGWYKLVGTMDFQTENGIMTPILNLKEMVETKEPDVRIQ